MLVVKEIPTTEIEGVPRSRGCRETKGLITMTISLFLTALGSDGPPADRPKGMDLYGWLIGSWDLDTIRHLDDGTIQKCAGECHFGWVLEGRAIQDIWIRPKRPAPSTHHVWHDVAHL